MMPPDAMRYGPGYDNGPEMMANMPCDGGWEMMANMI